MTIYESKNTAYLKLDCKAFVIENLTRYCIRKVFMRKVNIRTTQSELCSGKLLIQLSVCIDQISISDILYMRQQTYLFVLTRKLR